MALYRFPANSLIREITFVPTEKGGVRGYLHAKAGASPEAMRKVIDGLTANGMETVPYSLDGKPVLEVRNFKNEKSLFADLRKYSAIEGTPQIDKRTIQEPSLTEKFKQRSLQASGAFYIVGDAGFITYGLKEAHKEDVLGGILYALGTLSLLFFGNNDQSDLQVKEHARGLEQFLQKENVNIPQACSLHALAARQNKGIMSDTYDWMRSHPSELFNGIYVGAGACIAAAAVRHKLMKPVLNESAKDRLQRLTSGFMDLGLGTVTTSSALAANLIQEKKRDPDEPSPEGIPNRLWAWIQEKPLRVAGYGYMVSTVCHAVSTSIDYVKAKRLNDTKKLSSVPFRALFVGTNLIAELLLAISSKGHGEGVTSDDSVNKSVYSIAAEMIAKQPKDQREWHIQHVAGFLQQPNVLAESYDVVEKELRTQLALIEKNPWACINLPAAKEQKPWQERMPPAALTQTTPAPQPSL